MSDGMSPIRIEEANLFSDEIKEYKRRPLRMGELIKMQKTKNSSRYNPIKASGENSLKAYNMPN